MSIKEFAFRTVSGATNGGMDVARYHMKSLASVRVLWNWLLGGVFLWACWYGMTRIPASANTIIITLGGVFASMMANYVWSKHSEKKENGNRNGNSGLQVVGGQATAPTGGADDSSGGA